MVARELTATVIEPEEEVVTSWNYRFARIGHSVPIKPSHAHSQFDPTAPPSRPLAVSQRFGVLIVAHSTGFCVARTKDVMESAEKGGSGLSIQELSLVDLDIGKVSILALSPDSSTLAASIGSHLHLFSVTALLNKERKPSLSCYLDDSSCIKDMRWAPTVEEHYVVLSIDGKLYHGAAHEHLKDVMDNVDAVEWSEADNFVAVAKKNVLSILSSEFKERLSISLSLKSFDDESDANCIMKVDCIRWVRADCIVIGCFEVTNDGEEQNYVVQVITSKDGKITDNGFYKVRVNFNCITWTQTSGQLSSSLFRPASKVKNIIRAVTTVHSVIAKNRWTNSIASTANIKPMLAVTVSVMNQLVHCALHEEQILQNTISLSNRLV